MTGKVEGPEERRPGDGLGAEEALGGGAARDVKLVVHLVLTLLVVLAGMSIYELAKQLVFPDMGDWMSRVISVLFSSVVAMVATTFWLRRWRSLQQEVIERERVERALRESEETYKALLEASPDVVAVMDLRGCITHISQRALALHGWEDAGDLIGRDVCDLVVPEEREMVRDNLQTALAAGSVRGVEVDLLRKDGTCYAGELNLALIRDGAGEPQAFIATVRDVTSRKWAEEALQRSEERYRRLLESVTDYIYTIQIENGRPVATSHSPSCVTVTGYTPEEYAADPDLWYRMVYEEDREAVLEQANRLLGEGVAPPLEHRIVHKDGSIHWVRNTPVPRYSQSEHLATCDGSVSDITPRKEAEEALALKLEQLAALSRASQAVTASLELEEVLAEIVSLASEVVGSDYTSVVLVDEAGQMGQSMEDLPGVPALAYRVRRDGFTDWIVRSREALLIDQIGEDGVVGDELGPGAPRTVNPLVVEAGVKSIAGLPLIVKDRLLGVLYLHSLRPGVFQGQVPLLIALANQVAIALDNSRLYTEQQRRAEEAGMLLKIADAISSTLELNHILKEVALRAAHACAVDRCTILLLDDGCEVLSPIMSQFTSGRVDPALWRLFNEERYAQRIEDVPEAVQVVQERRPLAIPDARDSSLPRRWIESFDVGTVLLVPMVSRERVVGLMALDHHESGRTFTREQVNLAMAIGSQAAVAIENANLHQALQDYAHQLEQRVQERTAQLQAHYAQLEAVLRGSSDGIIVADVDGEIVQANPVAQAWLTQTLSPEDAALLNSAVRDLARRSEERPSAVLELAGLDLEMRAAPIADSGSERVVIAVHDVSHLKALDRMKSRFVSNVSHELRTPITTIKLYAALMQRTASVDKVREYLDVLAHEADRQARLVEDILQISRIDSGRLELKPRPTSLNELTRIALASHQMLAEQRGLTLEHRLARSNPVALVDPDRTAQVLSNLVANALQYTPEGGRVEVSTDKVKTDGRVWAVATVVDTGMGIPREELPHVFERFFRGERPRQMQLSGTGLGLAIVKEIVELHGGHVTVESEMDVGSAFSVWLPLAD